MSESQEPTIIYKKTQHGEIRLGYLDSEQNIYANVGRNPQKVGHIDASRHVFQKMQYDDRELGTFTPQGTVRSHGVFEGGELGWVEEDGVVIRGGLIFEEEEVGRVEGLQKEAAGAALLLLFLPEDFEASKYAR